MTLQPPAVLLKTGCTFYFHGPPKIPFATDGINPHVDLIVSQIREHVEIYIWANDFTTKPLHSR